MEASVGVVRTTVWFYTPDFPNNEPNAVGFQRRWVRCWESRELNDVGGEGLMEVLYLIKFK